MNVDKIIELLKRYINDYNIKQEEYDSLELENQLYKELIPLLEDKENLSTNKLFISVLLSSIYGNDKNNELFYKAICSSNIDSEYPGFLAQIAFDYKENEKKINTIKTHLTNIQRRVSTARRSIFYLQNKRPLFDKYHTFEDIRKIIAYYTTMGEISDKEEIILLNELEFYNRNIIPYHSPEKEYANIAYNEVPNILNSGFEMYDEIEISSSRRQTINGFVADIKTYIEQINKDNIVSLIESYKKYNLANNEYNYIVNEILKYYLFEALEYYKLLLDANIYRDRGIRNDAISTYYKLLELYLTLREYYNTLTTIETLEEEPEEETIVEEEHNETPYKLIFSHPTSDPTKAKLITDLKDIPEEYYQSILDLLQGFINNKKRTKRLANDKYKSRFQELKDDQIRIVLIHMSKNIFCINGVFVKKANNDMKMYRTMCNRALPSISSTEQEEQEIALGKHILQELETIVNEKSRKGSR